MVEIKLKRGEGKTISFTLKDRTTGNVIPLTNATQTLVFATAYGGTPIINKTDANFTKTYAATGIISVTLNTTDTDITPGTYMGELKTFFSTAMNDKSADIDLIISSAVI